MVIDQAIHRWWFGPMAWVMDRGGHFEHMTFYIALRCWSIRFHTWYDVSLKCWTRQWWYLSLHHVTDVSYDVYVCCLSQGVIKPLFKRDWRFWYRFVPNLLEYMFAESYQNRSWSDKVLAKNSYWRMPRTIQIDKAVPEYCRSHKQSLPTHTIHQHW